MKPESFLCLIFLLTTCSFYACERDEVVVKDKIPLTTFSGSVNRILIIGNSITQAQPSPELGWYGSWGMAATDSTQDYVHILIDSIRTYHSLAEIVYTGKGVVFEQSYKTYNLEEEFGNFKDFKPDLIIIRIGENINNKKSALSGFEEHFTEFIKYFQQNDETPVICVSSFWTRNRVTSKMINVCIKNEYAFLDLQDLYKNPNNVALSEYENKKVGKHPNNVGMLKIANRIWECVKIFFD